MAESGYRRIRPFKIFAVLMSIISLILTIISLAGPDWVSVTLYSGELKSWGLWWECLKVKESVELCISSDWLAACAATIFFAMTGIIIAIVAAILGLCTRRRLPYIISGVSCVLSIICLIICLIIYPVMFTDEVKNDASYQGETSEFLFDWTYGMAWAAVCFLIGATIFFFIRVKEEHEAQPMKSAYGRDVPPSFYNNPATM